MTDIGLISTTGQPCPVPYQDGVEAVEDNLHPFIEEFDHERATIRDDNPLDYRPCRYSCHERVRGGLVRHVLVRHVLLIPLEPVQRHPIRQRVVKDVREPP